MADTSAFMHTILSTYPASGQRYTGDAPKLMNDADISFGVIFQVPEDCNLTHANILCKSVAGTQPYFKCQLWPMDTSNNAQPDTSGTVLAETAAYQHSTGVNKTAFTSAYSATQGQVLCCIIVHSSGTIDGSNYCELEYISGRTVYWSGFNTMIQRSASGGSYTTNGSYYPSVTVTTNKTYDVGGVMNHGYMNAYTGTTGYRYAQKFILPADKNLELHCVGFRMNSHSLDGTDVAKIGAWNAAGAELIDTQTIDADTGGGQTAGSIGFYLGESQLYFAETLTMVSGGTYYLGIEHVSGGIYLDMLGLGDDYDEMSRAYPGKGWVDKAAYWNGSSWDEDWVGGSTMTPGRFLISPILSDMHGVAGGGGSSIPGPSIGVIG